SPGPPLLRSLYAFLGNFTLRGLLAVSTHINRTSRNSLSPWLQSWACKAALSAAQCANAQVHMTRRLECKRSMRLEHARVPMSGLRSEGGCD
ncbi:hypothetical protein CRG98_032958, partial [Punica granatum]